MEKDKTMQLLERFLPQLAKNDTYYMQTTEFITAFKALAEALKTLRIENRDTTSTTMDRIEALVNDVLSTHKTIENKADKSIALSDKVLDEYKITLDNLKKEVEDFKNTIFTFKDGKDAKPEDVVPLVMAQIPKIFTVNTFDDAPKDAIKGDIMIVEDNNETYIYE